MTIVNFTANQHKYSKAFRAADTVLILTYSFNREYVLEILTNVRVPTHFVASQDFYKDIVWLNNQFTRPDLYLAVHPELHAKLFIVDDEAAHISTANFTRTVWHELDVQITDRTEVKRLRHYFWKVWEESTLVTKYFKKKRKKRKK